MMEIEIYAKRKMDFKFNVLFSSFILPAFSLNVDGNNKNDGNTSTSASTLLSAMNRSTDPCKRHFHIFLSLSRVLHTSHVIHMQKLT